MTSIAPDDHSVLRRLSSSAKKSGTPLILIGDVKSPPSFNLPGVDFYAPTDPRLEELSFSRPCPTSSYSRKNLGYLLAARMGVEWLVETDDDNEPCDSFWEPPSETVSGRGVVGEGWVNAYAAFTEKFIYPRGLPLEKARTIPQIESSLSHLCPIQQRLVNGDPDVDATYRLLFDLPFSFESAAPLVLRPGQWCPFNSQNTVFFRRVFPLLYLPTFCSFRMTDIWRSFVAQRVLHANGYGLSFHQPNAVQHRNEHDLMKDFEQEIPGYLGNSGIVSCLSSANISSGEENLFEAVYQCYEALVSGGWISSEELPLLEAWLECLAQVQSGD